MLNNLLNPDKNAECWEVLRIKIFNSDKFFRLNYVYLDLYIWICLHELIVTVVIFSWSEFLTKSY